MKRTKQPKKRKIQRKLGFLTRMKKSYKVIMSRRKKGRWQLTV